MSVPSIYSRNKLPNFITYTSIQLRRTVVTHIVQNNNTARRNKTNKKNPITHTFSAIASSARASRGSLVFVSRARTLSHHYNDGARTRARRQPVPHTPKPSAFLHTTPLRNDNVTNFSAVAEDGNRNDGGFFYYFFYLFPSLYSTITNEARTIF